MTITDAIKSGFPITIELLRELPDSVDPLSWSVIRWTRYKVVTAVPTIEVSQSGTIAVLSAEFEAYLDEDETCNAFGLKYGAEGFIVGNAPRFEIRDLMRFIFAVRLVILPWVA